MGFLANLHANGQMRVIKNYTHCQLTHPGAKTKIGGEHFTSSRTSDFATDLYINKLDAGLATLSIAKGDPFKLTSPAQHALHG